jgi:hypothetical protein
MLNNYLILKFKKLNKISNLIKIYLYLSILKKLNKYKLNLIITLKIKIVLISNNHILHAMNFLMELFIKLSEFISSHLSLIFYPKLQSFEQENTS